MCDKWLYPTAAPVAPPITTHTRTHPSDQGAITPGSDQPASQSYQCSDDDIGMFCV